MYFVPRKKTKSSPAAASSSSAAKSAAGAKRSASAAPAAGRRNAATKSDDAAPSTGDSASAGGPASSAESAPSAAERSTSAGGAAAQPAPRKTYVEVTVVGAEGPVAAGVTYKLTDSAGTTYGGKTDGRGQARIADVPDGDAKFEITVDTSLPDEVPPTPFPVTTFLAIELVDETGEPAAGRNWQVVDANGKVFGGSTDDAGKLHVAALADGSARLSFLGAPEALPPAVPIPKQPSFVAWELLDENGAALANVACKITDGGGNEFEATSDDSGYVRVENVLAGQCTLVIDA